ncbi:MAG: hypothetical protein IAE79_10130 [Anaerolinea sp.]|nr:hypothetical protein [Anaerolinea sp.]
MSDILLTPPIAFLIFLLLVSALSGMGRLLAGPSQQTEMKSSTYSSGEAPPTEMAAPGYRPFFVVALFFAILHLGVLVLGVGGFGAGVGVGTAVYLVGLALALLALIVG